MASNLCSGHLPVGLSLGRGSLLVVGPLFHFPQCHSDLVRRHRAHYGITLMNNCFTVWFDVDFQYLFVKCKMFVIHSASLVYRWFQHHLLGILWDNWGKDNHIWYDISHDAPDYPYSQEVNHLIDHSTCQCCLTRSPLTHWGRDKIAAIFQATFSNAFF